jgi:hypothetical protein
MLSKSRVVYPPKRAVAYGSAAGILKSGLQPLAILPESFEQDTIAPSAVKKWGLVRQSLAEHWKLRTGPALVHSFASSSFSALPDHRGTGASQFRPRMLLMHGVHRFPAIQLAISAIYVRELS